MQVFVFLTKHETYNTSDCIRLYDDRDTYV